MKRNEYDYRCDWIIEQLEAPLKLGSHYNRSINVLDADFVNYFIEKFNVPFAAQPYGASTCPTLGKQLSKMYKDSLLTRTVSSIHGMGGMGFPKWVYDYNLPSHRIQALRDQYRPQK